MSIEIFFYPTKASEQDLVDYLFALNYQEHIGPIMIGPQSTGTRHFRWFDSEDFRSADGVEANVYKTNDEERQEYTGAEWALHTRTRIWASSFDHEKQNETIRSARRKFGGSFYNDHFGKNRYIKVTPDKRPPEARGIWYHYSEVRRTLEQLSSVIPEEFQRPKIPHEQYQWLDDMIARSDPNRILYNALVPFLVAAIETFFGGVFRILLRYDLNAQEKMLHITRKVDLADVVLVSTGALTLEDIVASWYSFQNIDSIHRAFNEWLDLDFWSAIRTEEKHLESIIVLDEQLMSLLRFRHGVVHRFELDEQLDRSRFLDLVEATVMMFDALVRHIGQKRSIYIGIESYPFAI